MDCCVTELPVLSRVTCFRRLPRHERSLAAPFDDWSEMVLHRCSTKKGRREHRSQRPSCSCSVDRRLASSNEADQSHQAESQNGHGRRFRNQRSAAEDDVVIAASAIVLLAQCVGAGTRECGPKRERLINAAIIAFVDADLSACVQETIGKTGVSTVVHPGKRLACEAIIKADVDQAEIGRDGQFVRIARLVTVGNLDEVRSDEWSGNVDENVVAVRIGVDAVCQTTFDEIDRRSITSKFNCVRDHCAESGAAGQQSERKHCNTKFESHWITLTFPRKIGNVQSWHSPAQAQRDRTIRNGTETRFALESNEDTIIDTTDEERS